MAENAKKTDPDSVTRTSTDVESRDAGTVNKPAPPEDTPRTSTDVESRDAEQEKDSRPPKKPDPPRG